ncbi:hypothetical protein NKJ28_23195 [Mesorhizobium sp. M0145]|uniref:hypothetical protein n=1 Tax=Mesorhizobium sp. M0145 TaxID=2956895 RepID=UPI003336A745
MPATGGTLDSVKAVYSAAFSWSFTDYGPTIQPLSAVGECRRHIVKPIFSFPGGRRFHFVDPAGNEMAVWGE